MANEKKIGDAFHEHEQALGFFADAGGRWDEGRAMRADGTPEKSPNQTWGWAYQILPYLGHADVWADPDASQAAAAIIPGYFCPSRRQPMAVPGNESGLPDGKRGAIDYAGNGGNTLPKFPADGDSLIPPATTDKNGTVVPRVNIVRVSSQNLPRGASRTLLVGEQQANLKTFATGVGCDENNGYIDGWDWDTIRWSFAPFAPDRNDDSKYSREFGSSHPDGVNFLFADGAVRYLAFGMSLDVFRRLSDRNSDEAPPP
jgi:prepilin-type processing-associated H-X9-DG protein